ncbi:OsmC family protein [Parasphingorhabdus sp.]|uniref:OsmC family protein n=1 Tax=Parasphingorhabdus sp. TaxID=2709688 RepID=UPI003A90A814
MKNSISVCALSEFVNEVESSPEEACASYAVDLEWQSGARSKASTAPMKVGPHTVSRTFSWSIDEPRQLLGSNHAPNPQEYLLSGFAGCLMMAFVSGATAQDIQLETAVIHVTGDLDLRGFLGAGGSSSVGFSDLHYRIEVCGDAAPDEFEALMRQAESHSPNAMTLAQPVKLHGEILPLRSGDRS